MFVDLLDAFLLCRFFSVGFDRTQRLGIATLNLRVCERTYPGYTQQSSFPQFLLSKALETTPSSREKPKKM